MAIIFLQKFRVANKKNLSKIHKMTVNILQKF